MDSNEGEATVVGILLAAGQGKRMNSSLPKVAHLLYGKPLIIWAIESLIAANILQIVVVINHAQPIVEEIIGKNPFPKGVEIKLAYQDQPLGTGHAAQIGMEAVKKYFFLETNLQLIKNIIVAYGDTPAVQADTFAKLLDLHRRQKDSFTLIAFEALNPTGYGRILVDAKGSFLAIREEKDCNQNEKQINLCNSGFLCANFLEFLELLPQLKNNNAAQEFYLTDIPILARQQGKSVGIMKGVAETELLGINSQEQLSEMEIIFQQKYGVL